jgi:hypothetical protein
MDYFIKQPTLSDNNMNKKFMIFKALIADRASVHYVGKTAIKRTPGDVTVVGHN